MGPSAIPDNLLEQIQTLLMLRFQTEDERKQWRFRAFENAGQRGRALANQLDLKGAVDLFTDHVISKAHAFGEIETGRALSSLLRAVRESYGLDHQAHFDAAIAAYEALPRTAQTNQRAAELAYLARLQRDHQLHIEKFRRQYTPLAGKAQTVRAAAERAEPLVFNPALQHLRRRRAERGFDQEIIYEPIRAHHDDILPAMAQTKRAVLLGEPGAGKTTTLWRYAVDLLTAALDDPAAPLPLMVRLGEWTDANEPLPALLARELSELAPYLHDLLASARAVLLLDGLNEVPPDQRKEKARAIRAHLLDHEALVCVISCREADYDPIDLGLDRLLILPLDPPRIRDFAARYLGTAGEDFFWELVGGKEAQAIKAVWQTWSQHGATFEQFFATTALREEQSLVYSKTTGDDDALWARLVRQGGPPGNLIRLAANPFLLIMLLDVYGEAQALPPNRGALFDDFVAALLTRELQVVRRLSEEEALPLQQAALAGLGRLALAMQTQRPAAEDEADEHDTEPEASGAAVTVLSRAEVVPTYFDETLLLLAQQASLVHVSDTVRFAHQLLQEYFAARAMQEEIKAGRLQAADIWPRERWWERTNWEEATVLLAGLASTDCTTVLDWVGEANPAVAALCIARSGATVPDTTREYWRQRWLARLVDVQGEPDPRSRARVGRALAVADLDNRAGVGAPNGVPDIEWRLVPAGHCRIGGDKEAYESLPAQKGPTAPFWIARYLVTNAQFAAFIAAADGYANAEWWEGLQQPDTPREPEWAESNHPRENVDWYEATAFCRWLEAQRRRGRVQLPQEVPAGYTIHLPTEAEWEKAASWDQEHRRQQRFPWGDRYVNGAANIDENLSQGGAYYLARTSPVGMYPQGASPCGVEDLSGNVWEWTASVWADEGSSPRVLRGGSWNFNSALARAASRYWDYPNFGLNNIGFRVVVSSPIH